MNADSRTELAQQAEADVPLASETARPVRVLVAGLRGLPDVEGGVESHARHLYPIVASLGWNIEIAVRRRFHPRGTSDNWGRIRLKPLWCPSTPGVEAFVHTLLATLYAIRTRPDIYHVHAVGPAVVAPIARLFGVRVVVTHHGPDYDREKWGRFSRFVLRLGERLGMQFAHGRIAISQTVRDLVAAKYSLECSVIPNGVGKSEPTACTGLLEALRLVPGRYVLQVSRLVPEKRQRDLVQAFLAAALPEDWRLVLVGDVDAKTPYVRELQELSSRNERVVLAGYRSGAELAQLFQNAAVFVLPSSHEGLPIALLEAMSYGIRAIASDIPANLEVGLPDDCYFSLGDVKGLAARLCDAADRSDGPDQADERRQWVLARYDWETIARQTIEIYQAVAHSGRSL